MKTTHALNIDLAKIFLAQYLMGFDGITAKLKEMSPGDVLDLLVDITNGEGKVVGRITVKAVLFEKPVNNELAKLAGIMDNLQEITKPLDVIISEMNVGEDNSTPTPFIPKE